MARALLESLLAHFGPQRWWRGASRFEIVVGALLVQRTTWINAARAVDNLRDVGILSVEGIAASDHRELEPLIRPAGFFRTKATRLRALAQEIAGQGGLTALDALSTASLRRQFLGLPGIGPETADVIVGYAFERAVFVVDAYARRLFERLGAPRAGPTDAELKANVEASLQDVEELNELHALIVAHGKSFCRPSPRCPACPLSQRCSFAAIAQDT